MLIKGMCTAMVHATLLFFFYIMEYVIMLSRCLVIFETYMY